MNSIKRAWLSVIRKPVIRKPVKSLIIFSVTLVISTVLIASSGIGRSARLQPSLLPGASLTGFTLRNPPGIESYSPRGLGMLPDSLINDLAGIKNITHVNKRMIVTVNIIGAKPLKTTSNREFDEETEREYGPILNVVGQNNTLLDNPFRTGSLELLKGRHIKPGDKGKAIIHEDFAKANNLDIGSTFSLKANTKVEENIYKSDKQVNVEIVGMFKGENRQMAFTAQELNSNLIYTDIDTTKTLYNYPKGKEIYHDASFFTEGADKMKNVIKEVRAKNYNWNLLEILRDKDTMPGIEDSVKNIEKMVHSIIIGTSILSAAILSTILFMWVNDRKKEIGILLSMGVSKLRIGLQFTFEILIIATLAVGLSYFSGKGVAQKIGNKLTQAAGEAAGRNIRKDLSAQLGADIDSASYVKTIEKLNVRIGRSDLIFVSLGTLFIVSVSSLASLYPLVVKKPRNLLSEQ